ncbi:putative ATP-dependent RNA helicase DDX20 [Genypterus blacodes]|uniref:putative ATP-dependent RNA helicase DDX20 n=1 Tax=Genypterus blacodes TaxID=154954 RepID=UPI003F766B88
MSASVPRAAHDIESRKRSDDVLLSEGINFSSLLLSPAVLDGLSAAGFHKPSPIQLKAIPLGRCGLDLIVQAKSGTGKTCVFCTIALDSLVLENAATQVLVLAPTREIAVQIHSVVMAIGCAMEGLESHVFIGGRPVSQDKLQLRKCHVAVGSPGRIKQLIELGMLSTASIRLFVLDEADKLLEEGSFQDQINWIFSSLPANKQMLALSATYPESLAQHLTRYMREPTFVRLNPKDMGLKGLTQYYKLVKSHALAHKIFEEKVQHLLELFSKLPFNQALVFSNLHTRAQHLADILSSKGLPAACISGGLSQDQRLEAMSKLKQYKCRVLISTDLTSRGIDAEKVNLVINLDVPQDWETYMHRIGRAGRFGTQGLAVTYCCHGEEENKMMAIAQKCGLSLSALPTTIEPGMMEEACDWDVCSQAATPTSQSELFPRTEKKRRPKAEAPAVVSARDQEPNPAYVEDTKPRKQGKTRQTPRLETHSEETPKRPFPPMAPLLPKETPATPDAAAAARTRREMQEALPKIPPLTAFKNLTPTLMTFEEAELDFQNFMTKGLGRSVEIIRQFGSQEQGGHCESIMLEEDGSQSAPRVCEPRDADRARPRSKSDSSSSRSDMEESQPEATVERMQETTGDEYRSPNTKARQASPVEKVKAGPEALHSSVPRTYRTRSPSHRENRERSAGFNWSGQAPRNERTGEKKQDTGKPSGKVSGMTREAQARERDEEYKEEEEEEEEEEDDGEQYEEDDGSSETYWRDHYRAWSNYYASMSPVQQDGYHGYYSLAHNWMAAYRMNTVYMEELLKN